MLNLQQQQQQQKQILNAVLLGSLASDNTTIPVKSCPFEHCVRRFKEFFKFLVSSLSTLVLIWASRSNNIYHSIISSLLVAACLHLYSVHAKRCVRKLARWYWYVYTENHEKVHDCSNLVGNTTSLPFTDVDAKSLVVVEEDEAHSGFENNDCGDLVGEEEDAQLILLDDEAVGLVGGDKFQMIPKDGEAVGFVGGDLLQDDVAVGFVGGDQLQIPKDVKAVGFAGGDLLKDDVAVGFVGGDQLHIPRIREKNDSHGANEVVCRIGLNEEDIGGDPDHVWKDICYVGGNASYSDKYSHIHSQNKNVDVELDSGSSVPSFSDKKKLTRGSSVLRRSRLRARGLIRFGPGLCRCLRPRSLRFSGTSVAKVSSFVEVEMMEIDEEGKLNGSFEHAEDDVDSFVVEPMDVDSLEEMSFATPPSESLVANISFDITGSKIPFVLEEGCSVQPLGNKCDVTQPADSSSTSRLVSWENDGFPRAPLVEEETRWVDLGTVCSEPAILESTAPLSALDVVPAVVVPSPEPAPASAPVVPEPVVPEPVVPVPTGGNSTSRFVSWENDDFPRAPLVLEEEPVISAPAVVVPSVVPAVLVPSLAPAVVPVPIAPVGPTPAAVGPTFTFVVPTTTITTPVRRAAPVPRDEIDEFFWEEETPPSSSQEDLQQPSSSYMSTLKKLQELSAARLPKAKPALAPTPTPRLTRQCKSGGMGRRKKS